MPQRSKFTPERCEKIIDALRRGATRKAAAGAAGISTTTFQVWMRVKRGPKVAFQREVARAEAEAQQAIEVDYHGNVLSGRKKRKIKKIKDKNGNVLKIVEEEVTVPANPNAQSRWLARRDPDRWAQRKPEDDIDETAALRKIDDLFTFAAKEDAKEREQENAKGQEAE